MQKLKATVVWENFGIKKILDAQWCPKIKYSKYFLQPNIYMYGKKKLCKCARVPAPSAMAIKKLLPRVAITT